MWMSPAIKAASSIANIVGNGSVGLISPTRTGMRALLNKARADSKRLALMQDRWRLHSTRSANS
jgi:hypothetical protein